MLEKLKLSHTIMYAKGHYIHTNIVNDLIETIKKDWLLELSTTKEVADFLINYLTVNFEMFRKNHNSLSMSGFFNDVMNRTKSYPGGEDYFIIEDYYLSIIKTILSYMLYIKKDEFEIVTPDNDVLPIILN